MQRRKREIPQSDAKLKMKQTSISAFFKVAKTNHKSQESSHLSSTQESEASEMLSIVKMEQLSEQESTGAIKIETIDEEELYSFVTERSSSFDDTVVNTAIESKEDIDEKEEEEAEQKREMTEETEGEEKKKLVFSSLVYTELVIDMLDTVLDGEAYLFDKEELDLFNRFKNLCDDAKHLFVRLLLRKHKWIVYDKIQYEDTIQDKDQAIQVLSADEFIETENDLTDMNTALHVLNRNQLKEITKKIAIKMPQKPKRHDYIVKIKEFAQQSRFDLKSRYGDSKADSTMKQLWTLIHSLIGGCVRIKDFVYEAFQRLQVVYYRTNMLTGDSYMTSSILVKMEKRKYPEYVTSRTSDIWGSRFEYLQYEEALLTEKKFQESLDTLRSLPASKRSEELSKAVYTECWALCEEKLPLWESFVDNAQEINSAYYLRRFEAGWIYTRLLHHGLEVLSRLREYELEASILKKLLNQRIYQLSRRGAWYERLSLIQMNYLCNKSLKTDRVALKEALQTCIDAIHDQRVHQIYLHNIYDRINRLERKLCIPKREQHDFSYLTLKTPKNIIIHAERINVEQIGKKSTWRSNRGAECSVEEIALEYYEKQGYKGFHAENGVITMICTLLFWNVIFSPIPGVFETPYQSAPLDLYSGEFYEARLELINQVLLEIANGDYLNILKTAYDRESPRNTMCVGINWKYELADLLEIAECVGPNSLASLCKLLFEEFGQRSRGMPDLCCWNYKQKKCLFSEVKGPGDRLSDTQKLWIETLSGFGVQIEVCYVKVWLAEDVLLDQE